MPAAATLPDLRVSVRELFGIDCDWIVPAFSRRGDHVPEIDPAYRFDPDTTLAILAGFAHDRRVMVQGQHGTGKSSHVEQVAARLGWPCVRVNLDGQVSRMDLIGRDAIVLREGRQVTEFSPGVLTWAVQNPVALVFDEYDAGRPDVMFVIQRVLEDGGRLTLLDQHRVIVPHPAFRIFATANTVGLGDASGRYHGTQALNQGQLDRWQVVATLDAIAADRLIEIVLARVPALADDAGRRLVSSMVALAGLTRTAQDQGELSTALSPRTVLSWAENARIFGDPVRSFRVSFFNKCDEAEKALVAELFQRCFDLELRWSGGNAWLD